MSEYTEQELASLSPEERAAIEVDIPEERLPPQFVEESLAAEAAQRQSAEAKVAADAAKATADAKAAADAKAVEDAKKAATAATTSPAADPAKPAAVADPVVVAPVSAPPDPFVSRFQAPYITDQDYEAKQVVIAKQFEDGEITSAQFQQLNGNLVRQKVEGDIAFKQAQQSEEQLWQHQQDSWFGQPGNAILRDDPRAWSAMQAQLETMYGDKACANYTNWQFLEAAGTEIKKLLGLSTTEAKPAAATKPQPALASATLPTTLADVPAASDNLEESEFAYMEKLDGMEYEFAVAQMDTAKRNRFLEAV